MGEHHANGWRVSRHRLVADSTVGVIANPMRAVPSGGSRARPRSPTPRTPAWWVRLTAAAGALGVSEPGYASAPPPPIMKPAGSSPSRRTAVSQRCSIPTSKTRSPASGIGTQAPAATSRSTCSGAQPA